MTRTHSTEDTEQLAKRLARHLVERIEPEESVLIGLIGPLGAGKTAFARGFVSGIDEDLAKEVTSPTYAVVVEHPTYPRVTHADVYRLSSALDLDGIGYRETLLGPGITLVEWIDRFGDLTSGEWIEIRLAVSAEDVREIRIAGHGPRADALVRDFDGGSDETG